MKILGITDSHDAGIALFENGKIVFAVNEERLSRIKLVVGFPIDSISYLKTGLGLDYKDIDYIVIAGNYGHYVKPKTKPKTFFQEKSEDKFRITFTSTSKILGFFYRSSIFTPVLKTMLRIIYKERRRKITRILREKGFTGEISFVDHHLSHAASALFSCPSHIFNQRSLVVTSDGAGDGLSTTIYIAEKGKLTKIHEINQYNSLALFYAYVTEICGFTPNKHEGKITGLAAFGKPRYLNLFNRLFIYKKGSLYNISGAYQFSAIKLLKKEIRKNFNKADLAASVQVHLEKTFLDFIKYWIKKTKISNILVSGGLFANVKLNQRINEIPEVKNFFVHQHMGDGGLAFGAGALKSFQKSGQYVAPPNHVYFGPDYTNKEIEEVLEKRKIKYKKYSNIEKEIARLLSKNKIVARFNGPMEYGPRALGNRSILYPAKDPSINDWLNKSLKRTEFMPFAPVTLIEEAEKNYKKMRGGGYTARFMTITFDCTDFMKKNSPATVHIDNTARPQLIDKNTNISYRKILENYYKLTGIPSLVNTSFNMHEEPIVCTPDDAIRSFLAGKLDYLAVGNYLIKNS